MFLTDDLAVEEWTLCFKDPDKHHWVQRFLMKGFRHCYAFKLSPGGQFYVIIDPARSHTHVHLAPANDEIFTQLTKNVKFVTIINTIDLNTDRSTFCRFNCVEVIKSLIGLKSFWTFTPYQLHKRVSKWVVK